MKDNEFVKIIDNIATKIDQQNRILALILIDKIELDQDKVWKLHIAGFRNKDIAEILGIDANTVSAHISNMKK